MPKLPSLSIAANLYTIFALLATATLALAGIALVNVRHQTAMTRDYETSLSGTQNVDRVNGLIYAVVMESLGIYMSPDEAFGRTADTAGTCCQSHAGRNLTQLEIDVPSFRVRSNFSFGK